MIDPIIAEHLEALMWIVNNAPGRPMTDPAPDPRGVGVWRSDGNGGYLLIHRRSHYTVDTKGYRMDITMRCSETRTIVWLFAPNLLDAKLIFEPTHKWTSIPSRLTLVEANVAYKKKRQPSAKTIGHHIMMMRLQTEPTTRHDR